MSIVAGFCTTVYVSMLQFLATCGCFQGQTFFQENCLGATIFALADFFGGRTLFFVSESIELPCLPSAMTDPLHPVDMSNVLVVTTALMCWYSGVGYHIFTTAILSEIWSDIHWFGWTLPWFLYFYPKHKREFIEKATRKARKKLETDRSQA